MDIREAAVPREVPEVGIPLVDVLRGRRIESVHSVALCVASAAGELLYQAGDIDRPYPVRSLAKPLLAAELLRCGAASAFDVKPHEIALAAGSHDGQQQHVQAAQAWLSRLGLDEGALLCGPAMEGRFRVGPPIANNCSGKHAAVLTLCRHLGLTPERYIEAAHPVQGWLVPRLLASFGVDPQAALLIDGCGMPIFCASLRQIATTFARFGVSQDTSIARVRDSMAANPTYVGGTDGNLDTAIVEAADGAVLGKIGAEGLHADVIGGSGIGIGVKVVDGNSRALGPVVALLLKRFAKPSVPFGDRLDAIASPRLKNAGGTEIGFIQARPLPHLAPR